MSHIHKDSILAACSLGNFQCCLNNSRENLFAPKIPLWAPKCTPNILLLSLTLSKVATNFKAFHRFQYYPVFVSRNCRKSYHHFKFENLVIPISIFKLEF